MAKLGCIGRAILRSGVCPTPAEKLQSAWDGGFGSGLAAPRNNVVLIGTNFLGGVVALRKFRVGLTGPSDAPQGRRIHEGMVRGAAGTQKNVCDRTRKPDHDNRIGQPTRSTDSKTPSSTNPKKASFSLPRRQCAPKSSGNRLTTRTLSGTSHRFHPLPVPWERAGVRALCVSLLLKMCVPSHGSLVLSSFASGY
jgi:hypothetical protein